MKQFKYRTSAECPRDCPRRSAIPNCHNPETCETWARYLKEQAAIKAAKQKFKAAENDVTAVSVERARKTAKEAKRHRCGN